MCNYIYTCAGVDDMTVVSFLPILKYFSDNLKKLEKDYFSIMRLSISMA